MKYKTFILLESYQTNTYLVWDEKTKDGFLIDPADKSEKLIKFIESSNINLKFIANTHGHGDHIGGNSFFANYFNVPVYIHRDDEEMLSNEQKNLSSFMGKKIISPNAGKLLQNKQEILVGESKIKVIHTPGHTRGGISLYTKGLLFSGDTLFNHSIGRTDLPGGNYHQLLNSIKNKLFTLPEDTIVLPGHGAETTIEDELVGNPFVGMLAR